jgi:ABC-2 type transport system ATP-binding protein
VLIIDRGRIVAEGSPESLRERWQGAFAVTVEFAESAPGQREALERLDGIETVTPHHDPPHRYALACAKGSDPRAAIFRLAVERGWTLVEMAPARASLEDVFVRLTTRDEPTPRADAAPAGEVAS